MNRSLGLALALGLTAAPFARAHAADPPEVVMEKAAQATEEMASIIDDNKANCDVMADKLNKFADEKGAAIREAKAAGAKSTPEQKKIWEEKFRPRVIAASQKARDGSLKCNANAKTKAAMEKIMK